MLGRNAYFFEVIGKADAVLLRSLGLVTLGLVKSGKALWGHRADVADLGDFSGVTVARCHAETCNLVVDLVNSLHVGSRIRSTTEERGSGLDHVDVRVQVAREGPVRGASDDGAVLVLVVVVLGVEKLFHKLQGQVHGDPVLGCVVAVTANTGVAQPLLDLVAGLLGRPDELIDLVGTQVGSIALVVRVRDWKRMLASLFGGILM